MLHKIMLNANVRAHPHRLRHSQFHLNIPPQTLCPLLMTTSAETLRQTVARSVFSARVKMARKGHASQNTSAAECGG